MSKLPKKLFKAIENFTNIEARELERNTFKYIFSGVSKKNVIESLAKYQNTDGGFGNNRFSKLIMDF